MMSPRELDAIAMRLAARASRRLYNACPASVRAIYSRGDLENEFIARFLLKKGVVLAKERKDVSGYLYRMYRNEFLAIIRKDARRKQIMIDNAHLLNSAFFGVFQAEIGTWNDEGEAVG